MLTKQPYCSLMQEVGTAWASSKRGPIPRSGHRHCQTGGKRAGNTINFGITWVKEVNGDRRAQMTIERIGDTGIRLTTVDTDPKTGKSIVTGRIDLRRT